MMREVCETVCPLFAQRKPVRSVSASTKIIPPAGVEVNTSRRPALTLSSGTYFDDRYETTHTAQPAAEEISSYGRLRSVVPAQNRRIVHEQPVKIAVYADMLKVSMPGYANGVKPRSTEHAGGGIRGEINGFSRASRKRLIETMAKVRNPGAMLFLTMTYDDSVVAELNDNEHKYFEAFRRRFERAFPTWAALWRKEWQDRKSGDFTGLFVPHYHLIIMTGVHYEKQELEQVSSAFAQWGKAAWHEVTSSADENHLVYGFDVSPVKSRKQAYYYVSKYIAKHSNSIPFSGRHWGRVGTLNCSLSEEISLDADEHVAFRRLVKRWLKRRAQVPAETAAPEEVERWLIRERKNRAYAARFARSSPALGFTVFGLGDCSNERDPELLFAGFSQFIVEVKRQIAERRARETGHGN